MSSSVASRSSVSSASRWGGSGASAVRGASEVAAPQRLSAVARILPVSTVVTLSPTPEARDDVPVPIIPLPRQPTSGLLPPPADNRPSAPGDASRGLAVEDAGTPGRYADPDSGAGSDGGARADPNPQPENESAQSLGEGFADAQADPTLPSVPAWASLKRTNLNPRVESALRWYAQIRGSFDNSSSFQLVA